MSQRIQGLTGWSPEQICLEPGLLDRAILADDRAAVAEARRSSEQGWRITFRLHLPDDRVRAFEEVATVLNDGIDHVVVGTLTDVTDVLLLERRNALLACAFQEIQASEAQSIALVDDMLQFVTVSDAFAACFGRPAHQLRGHSLDCLADILTLLPGSDPQAETGPTPPLSLRQLVEEVINNHRSAHRQSVLLLSGELPGEHALLDLLPLSESGRALGVLLRLLRFAPA